MTDQQMGLLGSLSGGLLNSVGSVIGNAMGMANTKRQLEYNKWALEQEQNFSREMQDKANAFTLDMWNRTNEYNDPGAQMQRNIKAGINPLNMQASTANAMSGQLGSTPQALGVSNPHIENPLAGFGAGVSDAAIKGAQARNINANTENVEADTELKRIDSTWKPMLNTALLDVYGAEASKYTAEAEKTIQDTINSIEELGIKKDMRDLAQNQFEWSKITGTMDMLFKEWGLKNEEQKIAIMQFEAMTGRYDVQETIRHNKTQEAQGWKELGIKADDVAEKIRHNMKEEGFTDKQIDITTKKVENEIKLARNANARDWIKSGTEVGKIAAGTACLFVPGLEGIGLVLLTSGSAGLVVDGKEIFKKKEKQIPPTYTTEDGRNVPTYF